MALNAKVKEHHACVYCGDRAVDRDHYRPFSYDNVRDDRLKRDYRCTDVVPACRECNLLLGNTYLPSIRERSAFLLGRVAGRHARLLKSPDWKDWELEELEGRLRKHVEREQKRKELVTDRLAHLQMRADTAPDAIDTISLWASAATTGAEEHAK